MFEKAMNLRVVDLLFTLLELITGYYLSFHKLEPPEEEE